jgi:hypothetical protein
MSMPAGASLLSVDNLDAFFCFLRAFLAAAAVSSVLSLAAVST